jgi:hypothetical protein
MVPVQVEVEGKGRFEIGCGDRDMAGIRIAMYGKCGLIVCLQWRHFSPLTSIQLEVIEYNINEASLIVIT